MYFIKLTKILAPKRLGFSCLSFSHNAYQQLSLFNCDNDRGIRPKSSGALVLDITTPSRDVERANNALSSIFNKGY